MALITGRIHELIIRIRVTGLARSRHVSARQREFRGAVVKCRRLPGSRGVTRLTVLAEVSRHMVWIRSTCKIRAVALIAI